VSIQIKTLLRRLALSAVVAVAASTLSPAVASAAFAAPVAGSASVAARSAPAQTAYAARMRGYHIVAAARAQLGKPYRFGAWGPSAFDCSGLTGYAYRSVRINLPRTADGQFRAARHVAKAVARPGDLVFWVRGGHAYHVAVYAGAGRVWHAPKPGQRVRPASIWSWGEVRFGRIGA
jgi:cell wall-associated NlpC family hydrolase